VVRPVSSQLARFQLRGQCRDRLIDIADVYRLLTLLKQIVEAIIRSNPNDSQSPRKITWHTALGDVVIRNWANIRGNRASDFRFEFTFAANPDDIIRTSCQLGHADHDYASVRVRERSHDTETLVRPLFFKINCVAFSLTFRLRRIDIDEVLDSLVNLSSPAVMKFKSLSVVDIELACLL
jgi:hypothetical protein